MDANPHCEEALNLVNADKTWRGVGYETADSQHIVVHLEANTQAVLALAYEQRTANLLALADHVRSDSTQTALIDVVSERMGLIQPKRKDNK